MKRSINDIEINKRKCARKDPGQNILLDLPSEVFELILEWLIVDDLKSLSVVNHAVRTMVLSRLFRAVKVRWEDVENVSDWKKNYLICKVRIMREQRQVAQSEWNVSIKKLFQCVNLRELEIELIGSSRCLKYKDDFSSEECEKIEKVKLVSFCGGSGDYLEKALFESTHLKTFKKLRKIELHGFALGKDIYNNDMENEELAELKEIKIVNCVWEFPLGISDIFSGCKPEIVDVEYYGEAMRFTCSERFKAMVNVGSNRRWTGVDKKWWASVNEVVMKVEEKCQGTTRPSVAMATAFTREQMPALERVQLAGWRV